MGGDGSGASDGSGGDDGSGASGGGGLTGGNSGSGGSMGPGGAGSGGVGGTPCVDEDGDGYGPDCAAGSDCNDEDPDNHQACDTCADDDSDGYFSECDDYSTRSGPDCDDEDPDNQTSCSTCVDEDEDGYFAQCDAYDRHVGPDCDDADEDNHTSCSGCVDVDGDGSFVGCDAYVVRTGPDCDDDFRDQWLSCTGCEDNDGDGYFVDCDGYLDHPGPDCDDAQKLVNPGEAEVADDGVDNDCESGDLVAATTSDGVFVDQFNDGCSNETSDDPGSREVPYCSLASAFAAEGAADYFVAQGSYPVPGMYVGGSERFRLYGSYSGGNGLNAWTRTFNPETTILELSGNLQISFPWIAIDGVKFVQNFTAVLQIAGQSPSAHTVFNTHFEKASIGKMLQLYGENGLVRQCRFVGTADYNLAVEGSHQGNVPFGKMTVERSFFQLTSPVSGAQAIWFLSVEEAYAVGNVFLIESDGNASNVILGNHSTLSILHNSAVIREPAGWGSQFIQVQEPTGLLVQNNALLVAEGTSWVVTDHSIVRDPIDIDLSNNVVYPAAGAGVRWVRRYDGPNNTQYATLGSLPQSMGTGNLEADPLFANPSAGNFTPSAGSALIDAGRDPTLDTPGYLSFDLDYALNLRPQNGDGAGGAEYDVGAIEVGP